MYYYACSYLHDFGAERVDEYQGIRLRVTVDTDICNIMIVKSVQGETREALVVPLILELWRAVHPYGNGVLHARECKQVRIIVTLDGTH